MFLREFVRERGLKYNTVYIWLKRQRWFEQNIIRVDDKIYLNDDAIELLKEKYPIEIEKENKIERQLIDAQQTIIKLQAMLYESQNKVLLLQEIEESSKKLFDDFQNAKIDISYLEKEKEYFKEKKYELELKLEEKEKELLAEKNKSWWDKLRGK